MNFNELTPAWYLNHSDAPKVACNEEYEFQCDKRRVDSGLPHLWQPRFRSSSVHSGSEDSGRVVASLDRKRLGAGCPGGAEVSIRGVFDKETRTKPLAFAADALSYGV
jgi:hypothetical protein